MLQQHPFLPATESFDDGATLVVGGAVVSSAGSIDAIDVGKIVENDGSIVGTFSENGAVVGGAEGMADCGADVEAATAVGVGAPADGRIDGAGGVTGEVGLGDEGTAAGAGVGTGVGLKGRVIEEETRGAVQREVRLPVQNAYAITVCIE